jgi:DNA-binding MarR family transcriptional regulator
MQRRRLVIRRKSRMDKRRIDLFLTAEGTRIARQTLRLMRAINSRIVAGFTATEARTLKALLAKARENLRT